MIICTKCKRQNEDYYKFCRGCGASLADLEPVEADGDGAEQPACPNCHADVSPNQKFCGECGTNLEEVFATSDDEEIAEEEASEKEVSEKPSEAQEVVSSSPDTQSESAIDEHHDAPADTSTDAVGALILINPDGSPGDIVSLQEGTNVIGRQTGPEVFAKDPFLSPEHAQFDIADGSVEVEDLDSLNGVFVRLTEIHELNHGDLLRIGQELLRFELIHQLDPVVERKDKIVTHGSNRGGAWGRLARISGENEATTVFLLRAKEHTIGREHGDILFRDDGYVSGQHARIFKDGDSVLIEDLQSSNGTFVRLKHRQTLPSGSLILLGKQPYRLQLR